MKLLKNIKYFIAAFAAVLLDFSAAKYISIAGGMPQFTFCFCVLTAFFEKEQTYAAYTAIALGAAADILSGHGFGTYTFTFTVSALATFTARDKLFSSGFLFMILDVFVLGIFAQTVYCLFHINDTGTAFAELLRLIILPYAIYNTVICAIFYPIAKRAVAERR